MTYPGARLFIDGTWQDAADGRSLPVLAPATGQEIGRVAHAGTVDLDRALEAARRGFEIWRDDTPAARSHIMRQAAGLMREPRHRPPATSSKGSPRKASGFMVRKAGPGALENDLDTRAVAIANC
jgi:succinate-semialdehyde dehydrogenase / glutarate-semialdehyde dehydrogenase